MNLLLQSTQIIANATTLKSLSYKLTNIYIIKTLKFYCKFHKNVTLYTHKYYTEIRCDIKLECNIRFHCILWGTFHVTNVHIAILNIKEGILKLYVRKYYMTILDQINVKTLTLHFLYDMHQPYYLPYVVILNHKNYFKN